MKVTIKDRMTDRDTGIVKKFKRDLKVWRAGIKNKHANRQGIKLGGTYRLMLDGLPYTAQVIEMGKRNVLVSVLGQNRPFWTNPSYLSRIKNDHHA